MAKRIPPTESQLQAFAQSDEFLELKFTNALFADEKKQQEKYYNKMKEEFGEPFQDAIQDSTDFNAWLQDPKNVWFFKIMQDPKHLYNANIQSTVFEAYLNSQKKEAESAFNPKSEKWSEQDTRDAILRIKLRAFGGSIDENGEYVPPAEGESTGYVGEAERYQRENSRVNRTVRSVSRLVRYFAYKLKSLLHAPIDI